MNREIKFRAWQEHKNKMLSWQELEEWSFSDFNFKGSQTVFQQFTGLVDKNGKQIYEGDILNHDTKSFAHGVNVVVEWFGSGFYCGYGSHIPLAEIVKMDAEVIGNIWENPELLK